MITIVLVEDHEIVRQGLRLLLGAVPEFQLVGEAADGLEAVELVERLRPQVMVLDLMIPRVHGLDVIRQVRQSSPRTRVLILSMHADQAYVTEALRYGASGYVLKDASGADLVRAILDVQAGRTYLSQGLAAPAPISRAERQRGSDLDIYETLTNRERLVLKLAAEGRSVPNIAEQLFISPRTAETHRANLLRKLGLRSQTDLVRFAIRKKIIPA